MNKNKIVLLGLLGIWIAIFASIFVFHVGIPARAIFLMIFLCAVWLAYWTISAIRNNYLNDKVLSSEPIQPEPSNKKQNNASSSKISRTGK